MNKAVRYGLQAFNYTLFMTVVWYFSMNPPYRQLEEGQAVVVLAFAHASKLREKCKPVTQEELNKLAPNMRLPMDCPRERSPITVQLYMDGNAVATQTIEPPGFHKDQGIDVFHRIKVSAGDHQLAVWMNDDVNISGPTYQHEEMITLLPEQQLVIDFDVDKGGFYVN